MINYVTNLPQGLLSGGFSSLNLATYGALCKEFDVNYAGPINPSSSYREKIPSKLRRMAGVAGDFFFFSERRLGAIAREVRARSAASAALDFFHGFTPWILTRPDRPYIALSDCTFADYVGIFHRREAFSARDLERIETAEADWLKNASAIILLSRWSAGRAIRQYGLNPAHVYVVHGYGAMEMPGADEFAGGNGFVFVSTNFRAKGGEVVLTAFRRVRQQCPDASLTIIGDRPAVVTEEPGIRTTGLLRKERPEDVERFRAILSEARALVHPTQSDVSPHVLIEAGYFGCPSIASRSFSIPEMIDHGDSGLLLDDPSNPEALADAMLWMIKAGHPYSAMRSRAWARARGEYSKRQFERGVIDLVRTVIDAPFART